MENMEFLYAEATLLFSDNLLNMEIARFIKCWQASPLKQSFIANELKKTTPRIVLFR